ncbi:uncharacterized protein LOC121369819 [Gigantopelta aegis]|uniref:uncharacterized protein LOC121369819 n=1 Tax=Gigantopelta aegis TaxID=1735272 RepID=UPI001B889ED0|nr:uncharacterized protein LOC121369819 [Gigantopelta aegis]
MAKGESLFKAPSSVELMTRNLGQFCEEITLDFFTLVFDFMDSSSEDKKSETSMSFTNVLLVLVVAFAVFQQSNTWLVTVTRRDWNRIKDTVSRVAASIVAHPPHPLGKRDVSDYDTNKNGVLDLDELEKVMSTRDAEDFLQFADDNGDSEVTVEEFKRVVKELNELE